METKDATGMINKIISNIQTKTQKAVEIAESSDKILMNKNSWCLRLTMHLLKWQNQHKK